MRPNLSPEDLLALSAYLDNALNDEERKALEQRLSTDDFLRQELERLRRTVYLMRSLKPIKAPRDFTLDPTLHSISKQTRIIRLTQWQAIGLAIAAILLLFIGFSILPAVFEQSEDETPELAIYIPSSPTIADLTQDDIMMTMPAPAVTAEAFATPTLMATQQMFTFSHTQVATILPSRTIQENEIAAERGGEAPSASDTNGNTLRETPPSPSVNQEPNIAAAMPMASPTFNESTSFSPEEDSDISNDFADTATENSDEAVVAEAAEEREADMVLYTINRIYQNIRTALVNFIEALVKNVSH
ncbi:MAG: hypothetical protein CUN55_00940 [Phototrophicales bacterium]|nr:MAG: hypothetical protein CUN55_00940 [Phototrophicales bacterium]